MPRKQLTKKQREKIHRKYLGHCAYCGTPIEYKEMQVDHFAPVYLFGDNTQEHNLMPSCRQCNFYKNTYTIAKFREQLGLITSRLDRDNFTYRLAKKYNLIKETNQPVEFYYEKIDSFLSGTRNRGMADWSDKDHKLWDEFYSTYGVDFVKWYQERTKQ